MREPRYKPEELWKSIQVIHTSGMRFYSLVMKKEYRIVAIDKMEKAYTIQYESGNTISVPLNDLYAIYRDLYRRGEMSRTYLRQPENGRRVVGHTRYSGSPGATIYGILPMLDEQVIANGKGNLTIAAR